MHERLLQLCRAAMPNAAGIVLATPSGALLAHEPARVRDPHALAAEAATLAPPARATSALVPRGDALFLVMFVPSADPRDSSAAPALPA